MYIKRILTNLGYLMLVFLVVLVLGKNSLNLMLILLCPLALVGLFLLNRYNFENKAGRSSKKKQDLPHLTQAKEEHYKQNGMSEKEIEFFRETMNTTRKQIQELEKNMCQVPKLRAIDLRNNTLTTAKAIFKELVKEPQKLHKGEGFLYTHLPNLLELTNKYIEINGHEVKNKNTYAALEKSALVIDELSVLLTEDFSLLVADDFAEMDVEISLAEQSLKRQQEITETEGAENDGK